MTKKPQNASEAMSMAKEKEGDDIFLVRLTREELEKSGFDTSDFTPFEYVDIYLGYWEGEYDIKYRFDSDPRTDYYERPKDVGGLENFMEDIAMYLSFQEEDE